MELNIITLYTPDQHREIRPRGESEKCWPRGNKPQRFSLLQTLVRRCHKPGRDHQNLFIRVDHHTRITNCKPRSIYTLLAQTKRLISDGHCCTQYNLSQISERLCAYQSPGAKYTRNTRQLGKCPRPHGNAGRQLHTKFISSYICKPRVGHPATPLLLLHRCVRLHVRVTGGLSETFSSSIDGLPRFPFTLSPYTCSNHEGSMLKRLAS